MACLFIVVQFVDATRTPGAGMIPLEPDLSQFYGLATSDAGNVTFAVTSKFVAVLPAVPGSLRSFDLPPDSFSPRIR
jgi:hypothetical protein